MRILSLLFLFLVCLGCKKEDKKLLIDQEVQNNQIVNEHKERKIYYPDTTRYDSIKNNFSLTSKNFNENRIDFTLPNDLEDFQIQFSNIPNDRLKIGYIKKENTLYIDQNKVPHKKTKKKKYTHISLVLDSLSISLSVNDDASYMTKNISPTIPYTVMTFLSKKSAMTNIVVSKNKTY